MASAKRPAKWLETDHASIYANMMGIGMSPFDIHILFGEVLHSDATSVTGVPRVKVILTPEQAQNLMKLLNIAVNAYTKTNGILRSAGAIDIHDFSEEFDALRKGESPIEHEGR
jgi:hypothetical protein